MLALGSVFALGLGLYAATRADVRALEAREQAMVTALELASNHVLDRQIELLDATTSQSGFIFVDNANVSIEALMADNERLLSTLGSGAGTGRQPSQRRGSAAEVTEFSLSR